MYVLYTFIVYDNANLIMIITQNDRKTGVFFFFCKESIRRRIHKRFFWIKKENIYSTVHHLFHTNEFGNKVGMFTNTKGHYDDRIFQIDGLVYGLR